MLYVSGEMSKPLRLQSAFIAEHETKRITQYLRKEFEEAVLPEVDFTSENVDSNVVPNEGGDGGDEEEDDLYDDAKQIVIESGKASTSYIQRKLRVGYARAARLMDMLEERGIVGPAEGSKPREVLVSADSADDADEGFGREQEHAPEHDSGETAQPVHEEDEDEEPPKAV
jgi:S-DNA-T family DNA segregation ATPase FtsK/SpoIIIE